MYQTGTAIEVLGNAFIAAVVAQVLKVLYFLCIHKKFNFKVLTTTGGMPSSHSATVIALSMTVGYNLGMNSIPFAIALGYAFVVMYDAAGVRRAAGKQAACLNKIIMDMHKLLRKELPLTLASVYDLITLSTYHQLLLAPAYIYP